MTKDQLLEKLQKMFDEAWEQNMAGNGTDLSRMVTTFVPMAMQELSAEEKHGKWLPQILLGQRVWDCSECKTLGSPHWKRCPVCEAKMETLD